MIEIRKHLGYWYWARPSYGLQGSAIWNGPSGALRSAWDVWGGHVPALVFT